MLKDGRVIAEGAPDELKSAIGGDWLEIVLTPADDVNTAALILQQVSAGRIRTETEVNRISVSVEDRTRALIQVIKVLSEARIEPEDITLRRPTLDEVFIHLLETDQTISQPEAA
jgi:ABC-2 type transport system ATP-binding protein